MWHRARLGRAGGGQGKEEQMFDLLELGETSPAQQDQEGKLVSLLGLSLPGGGGRHWV